MATPHIAQAPTAALGSEVGPPPPPLAATACGEAPVCDRRLQVTTASGETEFRVESDAGISLLAEKGHDQVRSCLKEQVLELAVVYAFTMTAWYKAVPQEVQLIVAELAAFRCPERVVAAALDASAPRALWRSWRPDQSIGVPAVALERLEELWKILWAAT